MEQSGLRFMLDECSDQRLLRFLHQLGYDVTLSPERSTGFSDAALIALSAAEGRILITTDLGITAEYYSWLREGHEHPGVLLGVQMSIGGLMRAARMTLDDVAKNPENLRNTHRWLGS